MNSASQIQLLLRQMNQQQISSAIDTQYLELKNELALKRLKRKGQNRNDNEDSKHTSKTYTNNGALNNKKKPIVLTAKEEEHNKLVEKLRINLLREKSKVPNFKLDPITNKWIQTNKLIKKADEPKKTLINSWKGVLSGKPAGLAKDYFAISKEENKAINIKQLEKEQNSKDIIKTQIGNPNKIIGSIF